MSHSISTLLTRNLHDVFGENDPARRRAAIDEIFTEDCVFYDPKGGIYRGRDEIDRIAGAVKATHPDFRYQPVAEPEEVGNGGRVQWVSGRPGEAPAYAGTDFTIARDGRIAAVYLFSTSCNSPSIATLTMDANFILIATPDKHPCMQKRQAEPIRKRLRCTLRPRRKVAAGLLSVFSATCKVFGNSGFVVGQYRRSAGCDNAGDAGSGTLSTYSRIRGSLVCGFSGFETGSR